MKATNQHTLPVDICFSTANVSLNLAGSVGEEKRGGHATTLELRSKSGRTA